MNAQEAARMVNSGMEKLSLAQLVEVHAVLKGDENSAGLFRLVGLCPQLCRFSVPNDAGRRRCTARACRGSRL